MATYITLSCWTRKGTKNLKGSPARLDKVKKAAKDAGGKLKDFYLTMGQYDLIAVWEFPDDTTCAKFILGVASLGTIDTQTLKAFSEEEYREITGSL
jgi:uncharacterized protein with GYD domain